jgi:hypothetical protein
MLVETLVAALIIVEGADASSIREDNGSTAYGCLQIHAGVIIDVNYAYATNYTINDALDPDKAQRICAMYLTRWGRFYHQQTGKPVTAEVLARIWNGGPTGWKRDSTRPYWRKAQAVLSRP